MSKSDMIIWKGGELWRGGGYGGEQKGEGSGEGIRRGGYGLIGKVSPLLL